MTTDPRLRKQVWPAIPEPDVSRFPWAVASALLVALFLALAVHQVTHFVDRLRDAERRVERLEERTRSCAYLWPEDVP